MSDETEEISYNKDNVELDVPDGEVVETIDKNDLKLVTVPGCQHVKTTSKPSEDIPGTIEVSCVDCPIGWFIRS